MSLSEYSYKENVQTLVKIGIESLTYLQVLEALYNDN